MFKSQALTTAEGKLAELIWRTGSIASPELVTMAANELGWKKSTTYTVLKKLCDKGVFRNDKSMVSILCSRDELLSRQSKIYVEELFGGSLPKFITAFFGNKKLTREQANELPRMIEEYERGSTND